MSNPSLSQRGCAIIDKTNEIECCKGSCNKLNAFDWLKDFPQNPEPCDIVEIRFKNTRKWYYKNVNSLILRVGDIVAVEASPGHDIGIVSLTGELVLEQMRKNNTQVQGELKKIYRKAKPVDIEKWVSSINQEQHVMLRSREIAIQLNLNMKIGDVEFQGDGTKAVFFYIADERVDFRELIKVYAEEFRVRIEMRQIGARQEAGRIGGIGSCGRELCCSTWITNFISVTTNSARLQELSLNPQKLAGQCGKLKCCLNYELETYVDERKDFPDTSIPIETRQGRLYHQKTDIFKRIMWYSFDRDSSSAFVSISVDKVNHILGLNKRGIIIDSIAAHEEKPKVEKKNDFADVVEQESINRFTDKKNKKKKRKFRKHKSEITDTQTNTTNL